jgi:glycosyltransferase involved in cell wall biosynthesis
MLIAHVCHRYYPYIGGVETHVEEICTRLLNRGLQVEVLTTDPSGKLPVEETVNGVKVRRFKSWAPNEAYYFSESLRKYLKKKSSEYDVVHAHGYHSFPALYAAQAKGRNKLVFTPHYHGSGHTVFRSLLHRPYKFLSRGIFERADKVVCVSNYEQALIFEHFRVDRERTVVIPNGIKLDEFRNLEKRSKNHKIALYVGRLEKYKGVHHLIRALSKLNDNISLEIVGKGPYKETLIRLSRKLGVENRVRFSQDLNRDELLKKYADSDVFVLLSGREAFGITVAEALASGTPCVLANTSALTEWIDNQNCFGIDYPVELDELVRAITETIGKKVHPMKLWDCEEVAEKTAELYYEVTGTG